MGKLKIIAGLAFLVMMCNAGWQIGKCEIENVELHDDMKDMASQMSARIGLGAIKSDDDFRNQIVLKAKNYDIALTPEQITVQRDGEGMRANMYFAADYTVAINLPGYSFPLHLTSESGPKPN